MTKPVSRREFMNLLGATFGTSALIRVGSALGMLPAVAALTRPVLAAPCPRGRQGSDSGRRHLRPDGGLGTGESRL